MKRFFSSRDSKAPHKLKKNDIEVYLTHEASFYVANGDLVDICHYDSIQVVVGPPERHVVFQIPAYTFANLGLAPSDKLNALLAEVDPTYFYIALRHVIDSRER